MLLFLPETIGERQEVSVSSQLSDDSIVDIKGRIINRSELARAMGVDVAHISRIFSGKGKPSLTLARRIANYYGVTSDELCEILHINGIHLTDEDHAENHGSNHSEETAEPQK